MTDFAAAKQAFLSSLEQETHDFATTLDFIDTWYDFTPSAFQNGPVANRIEQNQGSGKVLALSELLALNKEQTLRCFGEHYRDVLATPDVDNHHNLRRLLADGINEIAFNQFPLAAKV